MEERKWNHLKRVKYLSRICIENIKQCYTIKLYAYITFVESIDFKKVLIEYEQLECIMFGVLISKQVQSQ